MEFLRLIPEKLKLIKLNWQYLLALFAVATVFGSILWFRHSRNSKFDLPGIVDSGRLRVLTDSSSLGFAVKGDSVYGFQYEIIKAFADSLGLELQIAEQNDMKDAIVGLKNGEYDIIANFIPTTTEFQEGVLFTLPIISTRQMLVQRIPKDSIHGKLIKNQTDLANDTIYIPYNSPFKSRIQHLSDEIADTIHIVEMRNVSMEQMVKMVSTGQIKYTICTEHIAKKFVSQYENLDISLPLGFTQDLAWVLPQKSPLLLEKLNDFLGDFIGSSEYWALYQKYY